MLNMICLADMPGVDKPLGAEFFDPSFRLSLL